MVSKAPSRLRCLGGYLCFQNAERVHYKEREIACLAALNVSDNFDDEDRASAMSKIAEAASR